MGALSGVFLTRSSFKTVLPFLLLVVGTPTANATDALPVADGAYMRSAEYCEQFSKGQLGSIEFSVSKDGHAYDVPEVGCVVAAVRQLRANRYVVDADCLETGNPFQRTFILDVEGPQTIRIDGEELTSCDAQAPTDKATSLEVPLPRFTTRAPADGSKVEATKAAPPTKLIRQWQVANENCRGGSGDDPQTEKACGARDVLARQLEAAKWCYGKDGQSGYQYKWHRCGKGSIHF
ncbi:hypothetical protein [Mesorhizobium erdmanii]|uniref:hypothetical protein n=1 Tax=Mesorhizobium erdmanii TaxID=1777866 RepID=UPI0012B5E393|nr:hypothetical protein [Mesorhizobium erdmanii]